MWRVGSSKQKIEVQFAHEFLLEVASNSIALRFRSILIVGTVDVCFLVFPLD
jgi:hypothetical protein